jgi:L-amino acid N-acyltransferase YncA
MGRTFQRETFAQAWPDVSALVAAHWREVAYPDGFPSDDAPSVDVDAYLQAEKDGRFIVFTLRDGDQFLGYAAFWLGPFPQRKGLIGAWQESIYIAPAFRASIEGARFVTDCDEALRGFGVSVVHHSVRAGRDFSPVLKRAGYVQAEIVYAKHLGATHGIK